MCQLALHCKMNIRHMHLPTLPPVYLINKISCLIFISLDRWRAKSRTLDWLSLRKSFQQFFGWRRAERKGSYALTKEESIWLRRLTHSIILFEERHKGKELSTKLKAHYESFLRRLHSKVSVNQIFIKCDIYDSNWSKMIDHKMLVTFTHSENHI